MFHPLFFEKTRKVLGCICFRCGRAQVSTDATGEFAEQHTRLLAVKNLQKRADLMTKLCGNTRLKRCGDDGGQSGCGARRPTKYVKEGALSVFAEWKEDNKVQRKEISAEEILRVFERISIPDMEALGFNPAWTQPAWMILTVMPVPPPTVRPSVIEESGARREDDLTHKLCDIIKHNLALAGRLERDILDDQTKFIAMTLQYHVATLMDNQIPRLPPAQQRNGRKLKSIADRLRKKEGRIRGNLSGKRVDQSARSVITPDPYMCLDEVGMPLPIAMNLTFPEIVNEYNVEEMRKCVRNGPDKWPGAKYVRLASDGTTRSLKYACRDMLADGLRAGDTVDRHLRDGDFVLFNRQPSLHKMSLMAHRVKIMGGRTLRLNPVTTGPYNADFDGDEMNIFNPQSVQTMNELMDLAAVPFMVLAPRDGKSIIELIQDSMAGVFRMTQDGTTVKDKVFANLMMTVGKFAGQLPQFQSDFRFTGRQAFSEVLPKDLFVHMRNKQGEVATIEAGALTSGCIDKAVLNAQSRGIVPQLFHDMGPFAARRFLDNTQRLVCRWLLTGGFSAGISDLVVDSDTGKQLRDAIATMKQEADAKIRQAIMGQLQNRSMLSNAEFFEQTEMLKVLNETSSRVEEIGLREIKVSNNRLMNMVVSGSKGKPCNIAQMVACVGQQNICGGRVPYGFTDRTLPHFTKFDDSPTARGFVESSFLSGLKPHEVFQHAMAGRLGLIDTACKTSDSGYTQRKLIKAMEDCRTQYDYTVRNASGTIVQYAYGEDGYDGQSIELHKYPIVSMDQAALEKAQRLTADDMCRLVAGHVDPSWLPRCEAHFAQLLEDKEFYISTVCGGERRDAFLYPVPIERIISRAVRLDSSGGQTDLTPADVLDAIDQLVDRCQASDPTNMRLLHVLLRWNMGPKPLLVMGLTRKGLERVVADATNAFFCALIHPGDMVGVVAAQTLGELSTQLVLDSFHSSGTTVAVAATSGLPRLKELLSVSHNMKTPSMTLFLDPSAGARVPVATPSSSDETTDEGTKQAVQSAKEAGMRVMHSLEATTLAALVTTSEVLWDPPLEGTPFHTLLGKDEGLMEIYMGFEGIVGSSAPSASTSPWVLRLVLNRAKVYRLGLTMVGIYMKLYAAYGHLFEGTFSDDNAEDLIIRIRLSEHAMKDVDPEDGLAALKALEHNLVTNVLLKGIAGVRKVSLQQASSEVYEPQARAFQRYSEWALNTDGSNLLAMFADTRIDARRSWTNDIWEIYKLLGIEGARQALYNELTQIFGDGVSYRHVSLLLDVMTNRGTLVSIDRHGINRNNGDVGPLARASFEESVMMLVDASLHSEVDNLSGVSASIILGALPCCGTGMTEVLLDEPVMKTLVAERCQGVVCKPERCVVSFA